MNSENYLQTLDQLIRQLQQLRQELAEDLSRTSPLVVCLDAGHGGTHPDTGVYMTPPQRGRYYRHLNPDGSLAFEIREGDINRQIAERVADECERNRIPVVKTYHAYLDSPLTERVRLANQTHDQARAEGRTTIFISLHSDAFGKVLETPFRDGQPQRSQPNGFSVFTSRGNTRSDHLAERLYARMEARIKDPIRYRRERSDGDSDWEKNFAVLYYTKAPAILVENLFFTNYEDAQRLMSTTYQQQSALAIFDVIREEFAYLRQQGDQT